MRLSPPGYLRFIQAESLDVTYGGGEANVAASLAAFGLDSYYVTRVPENPLGHAAVNHLRRFGVKTDLVAWGGDRLGLYYLENGAAQRASKVVYDRAGSSISQARPEDFDWEGILADCSWFHITGITPAISPAASELTLEAVARARAAGCTVSCDLNFRKNLWSPARAGEVMGEVMKSVDVCVANEEDAEKVFGIKAAASDVSAGRLDSAGYREVAAELQRRFGLKHVAITLRESRSASDNGWSPASSTTALRSTRAARTRYMWWTGWEEATLSRPGSSTRFSAGVARRMRWSSRPPLRASSTRCWATSTW